MNVQTLSTNASFPHQSSLLLDPERNLKQCKKQIFINSVAKIAAVAAFVIAATVIVSLGALEFGFAGLAVSTLLITPLEPLFYSQVIAPINKRRQTLEMTKASASKAHEYVKKFSSLSSEKMQSAITTCGITHKYSNDQMTDVKNAFAYFHAYRTMALEAKKVIENLEKTIEKKQELFLSIEKGQVKQIQDKHLSDIQALAGKVHEEKERAAYFAIKSVQYLHLLKKPEDVRLVMLRPRPPLPFHLHEASERAFVSKGGSPYAFFPTDATAIQRQRKRPYMARQEIIDSLSNTKKAVTSLEMALFPALS